MRNPKRAPLQQTFGAAALAMLVACGGSGDGDDDAGGVEPPAAGLAGTVATAEPVVGALLRATCADGSTHEATSGPDGRYAMADVAAAALPCALQADTGDGATLHAVVAGAPATVNLTPVTSLVVAALAGRSPADWFEDFDATAAAAVSPRAIDEARADVVRILEDAGQDAADAGDPHTASLAAGSPAAELVAGLVAGVERGKGSLAALEEAVAGTGGPLPASLLLQPAAANCDALRSGRYVVFFPQFGDRDTNVETIRIDATRLEVENIDGSTTAMSAESACRYRIDDGLDRGDLVVSPSGFLVLRYEEDEGGSYRTAFGFPVQTHTVASLAGDWQAIGMERIEGDSPATARYTGIAYSLTLAADGSGDDLQYCDEVVDCAPLDVSVRLQPNGAGGFDFGATAEPMAEHDRSYAYRTGSGEWLLASVAGDGSFALATPRRRIEPPADGSTSRTWGLAMNRSLSSPSPISESAYTTMSSTPDSWTRRGTDGHLETVQANAPRDGWATRLQGTAENDDGQEVTVSEFRALSFGRVGISVLWLPTAGPTGAPGTVFFSVMRPAAP